MYAGTVSQDARLSNPWPSPRVRRASPFLLLAVLVLLAAGLWAYLIAHVIDYSDGASTDLREDFVAFYAAATLVRAGSADAIYHPEIVAQLEESVLGRPAGRHTGLAFMNPPFVAGLFQPLSDLPYGVAQAVWFAIGVVTVAACLALLWPELRRLRRRWALVFALAAMTSYPVFCSLLYGQLSSLVLLSWVLFYRFDRQGRGKLSGLALAASLIKPQLAVVPVLYLLVTGRWRALGGFGAGAAALAGLSAVLAGPRIAFVGYPAFLLESLRWRQEFGVNRIDMFGWNAFFTRVLPTSDATLGLLLTVAFSLVTLAAAIVVWRRRRGLEEIWASTLALAAATILVSPHIHTHDLQILLLPAALVAVQRRDATAIGICGFVLFAVPAAMIGVNLATPALAIALAVLLAGATDAGYKVKAFKGFAATLRTVWRPFAGRHAGRQTSFNQTRNASPNLPKQRAGSSPAERVAGFLQRRTFGESRLPLQIPLLTEMAVPWAEGFGDSPNPYKSPRPRSLRPRY